MRHSDSCGACHAFLSSQSWLQYRDSTVTVDDSATGTDRTCERVEPVIDDEHLLVAQQSQRSLPSGETFEAHGDLRRKCDADCAASPSSLSSLENAAQEVDRVVGSRVSAGAHV